MTREVWIAEEGTITIWTMNSDGSVNSPAIRTADFIQNISARPIRRTTEFAQPGVPNTEVKSRITGHEIKIGEWFTRDLEQNLRYIDDTLLWMVKIDFVNPKYNGSTASNQENDSEVYIYARAVDGPEWDYQDNDVAKTSITFRAEQRAPVALVQSSSPISLSNTQVVNSVGLNVNDLCLVSGQSNHTTNGLYQVQAGAWIKVGQPEAVLIGSTLHIATHESGGGIIYS